VLCSLAALAGCHSHYIQATIRNETQQPLDVIQVDYPSASFGVQHLAPGAEFRYRFKLLGSGPIKLSYQDAARGQHAQTGPKLLEGQEGTLEIRFHTQAQAEFVPSLRP
jgi:hypothetical protein